MARKFHQIWLATGTNFLCWIAEEALRNLDEDPRAYLEVVESLEMDVFDRINGLFHDWSAAEMEGRAA